MNKLKQIRESTGRSQSQFAQDVGISKRVYQNYEQGQRRIDGAKIDTLLKISIAAKCRISDIIDDTQLAKSLKENGY